MNVFDADFVEAKKLKPAFAGILVDWSVGAREVTATIIDLAERGFLVVSGETVRVSSKKGASGFEEKFLSELFAGRESLSFKEVQSRAYGSSLDSLERILARGMIDGGLLQPDFQKRLAEATKIAVKQVLGVPSDYRAPKPVERERAVFEFKAKPVTIPSWVYGLPRFVHVLLALSVLLWVTAFFAVAFGSASVTVDGQAVKVQAPFWAFLLRDFAGGAFVVLLVLEVLLFPVTFAHFFSFFLNARIKANTGRSVEDLVLSDLGLKRKREALELKKFMERFPLVEDRLANELVGHAVAFGLGGVWLKKLGGRFAKLGLFLESVEVPGSAYSKLLDFESYLKEFEA